MTLQDVLDDLTRSAGKLEGVVLIDGYPTFDGYLVFANGTKSALGAVNASGLIGGFKFGYSGTGPDAFSRFLSLAGFVDTGVNTRTLHVPLKLMSDGTRIYGRRLQASVLWEDGSETPAAEQTAGFVEAPVVLGLTPDGADACVTLECAECGQPAVTVAVIGDQLAAATEHDWQATHIGEIWAERVRAAVNRADGGGLYEYEHWAAPGWCPTCELMFCERHWNLPPEYSHDDGSYDCPRGHRHMHFRSLEDLTG